VAAVQGSPQCVGRRRFKKQKAGLAARPLLKLRFAYGYLHLAMDDSAAEMPFSEKT
jgi:hypothetical protein